MSKRGRPGIWSRNLRILKAHIENPLFTDRQIADQIGGVSPKLVTAVIVRARKNGVLHTPSRKSGARNGFRVTQQTQQTKPFRRSIGRDGGPFMSDGIIARLGAGMHLDGNGLYLHVTREGAKVWKYRHADGKQWHTESMGIWPYVTTDIAREAVRKFRAALRPVSAIPVFPPAEIFTPKPWWRPW
mgnify:CR=1 FL=1